MAQQTYHPIENLLQLLTIKRTATAARVDKIPEGDNLNMMAVAAISAPQVSSSQVGIQAVQNA